MNLSGHIGTMKIYLDNCCLNRPFDDQSNLRIRLESEAVKVVLSLCEQNKWYLISSEIVEFEIKNTPDQARKKAFEAINSLASNFIKINKRILIKGMATM